MTTTKFPAYRQAGKLQSSNNGQNPNHPNFKTNWEVENWVIGIYLRIGVWDSVFTLEE